MTEPAAHELYALFPLRNRFRAGVFRVGVAVNAAVAGYGFVLPALLLAFWAMATEPRAAIGPLFWMEALLIGTGMAAVYFMTVEPLTWLLRAVPAAHALAVWLVTMAALFAIARAGIADLSGVVLPLPVLGFVCALLGVARWTRYEGRRIRIAGARVADVFD